MITVEDLKKQIADLETTLNQATINYNVVAGRLMEARHWVEFINKKECEILPAQID